MKHWIQKHGIVLSLLLVIAIMVMIFCFSAQTGEQSGTMSGTFTQWIIDLFVSDFENWPAEEQESLHSVVGLVVRKLGHFSEYALLGISLMLHIHQIRKRAAVPMPWLWSWIVGTAYAASDEFHQSFVAGRGPSVVDVMIDSSGVIAGTMLLMLILLRRQKKKSKALGGV